MEEYTKFRNKNRGYMKLKVWHKAIELYKLVCRIVYKDNKIEFKLRAQIADAAQSVSSNISEGYSRRSINEYIQHEVENNLWKLLERLEEKRAMMARGSLGLQKTLKRIIRRKPTVDGERVDWWIERV